MNTWTVFFEICCHGINNVFYPQQTTVYYSEHIIVLLWQKWSLQVVYQAAFVFKSIWLEVCWIQKVVKESEHFCLTHKMEIIIIFCKVLIAALRTFPVCFLCQTWILTPVKLSMVLCTSAPWCQEMISIVLLPELGL